MKRWLLVLLVACQGSSATPPDAGPPADAEVDPPPYRCDFADCQDGFARTCDSEPQTLDCGSFGAACGAFTDTESGAPFNWCTCGSLEESEGFCLGGRYGVVCLDGLGGLSDCGAGFVCAARPNGPFGIGCDCNNLEDGICPSLSCGADPDCATCTPECNGRSCGDNGCGGECGTCDVGDSCNASGQCEAICQPDCAGKQCGDDGCGGSCGQCEGACGSDGQCEGPCVPSCTDKVCGSDGCGGSCGTCAGALECNLEGACDCSFFATVTYKFTLAPQSMFPPAFTLVALNVRHVEIDGGEQPDGAFLGFGANTSPMFTKRVFGCRPHIKVKREYALSGKSCVLEEVFTERTDFTVPAPIVNADGSCTAPPM
jgi:hypothetical protein